MAMAASSQGGEQEVDGDAEDGQGHDSEEGKAMTADMVIGFYTAKALCGSGV